MTIKESGKRSKKFVWVVNIGKVWINLHINYNIIFAVSVWRQVKS